MGQTLPEFGMLAHAAIPGLGSFGSPDNDYHSAQRIFMSPFPDLKGKRAVVTGACGVIGRWLTESLLEAGCEVCVTDARQNDIDRLLSERPLPAGSFACAADLMDDAGVATLIQTVGDRWGAPDILVNNAGIYPSAFLLDTSPEDFDRMFGINLRAPFLLSKGFAIQMITKGIKGSIINVSSGASRKMRRTVVLYCTSKTALDRLTKGFAIELAEYGIRVNALEPGFAPGSSVSALTAAHISATVEQIPLGRQATRADVGAALLYLASTMSAYVTGSTMTVDGGNSIGALAVHQDKKRAL
jgi:3-oxoacyl-[acyl-carrier protein] reductase